LNSIFNLQS